MMRSIVHLALMAVLVLSPAPGYAEMITYHVGGIVSRIWQADNILGIVSGDAVTGSFSINLDATSAAGGDGTFATYSNVVDNFELLIGGVQFSQNGALGGVFIRNNSIPPSFNYDAFELTGLVVTGGGQTAHPHLNIVDNTGTMFSDLSLDNARNLTLAGHSSNFLLSFFDLPAPPGYSQAIIVDWQSLTKSAQGPVQVPEPATLALVGAALLGVAATRGRKPASPTA